MGEPLPLATIQDAVLEFLRGRDDAALFGAQAVNAYVDEPRATQDVDIVSIQGRHCAEAVRTLLAQRFQIAARVREVAGGKGFRVYQLRKPQNRHLVDVRPVTVLPPTHRVDDVLVVTPAELLANKVVALSRRRRKPKGGTDWRDIAVLLLKFPNLKADDGAVRDRLEAAEADASALETWSELVRQEITAEQDEDEFGG
jgi:hypothetical protein